MPLEQVSNNLTFYAFFTYTKQGVAGLTVTADVYRSGTSILTAQACTAVGGGLYSYTLSSANVTAEGEYICLFKTASTSVDQQHIPAIWCIAKAGVEYLDAQVTSRAAIADYTTARAAKLDNLDAAVTSRLASSAYTPTTAMSADVATILTRTDVATSTRASAADYTSSRAAKLDNIDAAVSSRLTPAGITDLQADVTSIKIPVVANLDTTVSSRLAPADITSLQADVTAIKTPVVANVDATISSRLASSAYTPTTAMSADVATILSRTDVATSTRLSTANYVSSVGSGAISYVVTVTQPDGTTPISGCSVWVTTDSGGSNTIAGPLYTNTSGNATFLLASGSYYLWRTIPGWNFTNPTSITVS